MRIISRQPEELEKANGGYFGTDLNNLAKELGITYRDLQKRLIEPKFE